MAQETDLQKQEPLTLPLIPLRGVLVFPNVIVHLDVGRERSVNALDEAVLQNQEIFLCMQKKAQNDEPSWDDIYEVGTVAAIKQILKLPGGTIRLVAEGLHRAKVTARVQDEPFMVAKLEVQAEDEYTCDDLEMEALCRHLRESFEKYISMNKKLSPEAMASVNAIEEPGKLADLVASYLNLHLDERQQVLETFDVSERIIMLMAIISKELEILEIDQKINGRVRRQMEKNQREYYLREQIKAIQKELGDQEERDNEIAELRERMEGRDLPPNVVEKIEKELQRLYNTPPQVAEANVIHNYLDCLLDLPWEILTEDNLDIKAAETVLNEDHYGITKVKERILEHLSVRQMVENPKGSILCFVGPPGVGKTSLAKSIARALGRKYVRISLGGVRDEAEIRGHRRTYIGAMPGRIIQSIKNAGSRNPLFLLDEIDKLANDFRGDPASALLEVLDPEQNNTFSDHYVELPFDLSKVLFITTANVEYDIPSPLRDRMEIIRLSSYTDEEKLQIALRHLLPKQYKEHGLNEDKISISANAIKLIISQYTREAGVRNLERSIAKICRQAVRQIVEGNAEALHVNAKNLHKYLGPPRFRQNVMEKDPLVGVATGLAWTECGGDTLSIEAQKLPGKGKLILTGQLGDVMKESAQAGWTFLRSIGNLYNIPADVEEKYDVHIHVPEGAIPKDGPSAGVTLITALASLFSGRKVRADLAMTGEITLQGRVLPVGGIKEKSLAAYRAGYHTVLLPKENNSDLEEIPENIRHKMDFRLMDNVSDILEIALLPEENKPEKKPSGRRKKLQEDENTQA